MRHTRRLTAGAAVALAVLTGCSTSTGPADDGSFGEPAAAEAATRTVEVSTLDTLAFDPAIIQVQAGEVVTFVVANPGQAVHEFVIGDVATQEEHADEMAEMQDMEMADDPNAVTVAPGETAELTWRFPASGAVLYGCHQPGHYAGGMAGGFEIS